MTELRRQLNYYAAIAASYGVPGIWLEDAAVDIWVTCWRRRNHGGGTVRSAAIDAARRYGRYSQRRVDRLMYSLEHETGSCGCRSALAA